MPKENINDIVNYNFHAEVLWNLDRGKVEIATVRNPLPEWTDPHRGWTVTLDRAGINRMIRALRKARDQVYGADA